MFLEKLPIQYFSQKKKNITIDFLALQVIFQILKDIS